MSILHSELILSASFKEQEAIAALETMFAAQRVAFDLDRNPSLESRRRRINRLIDVLLEYRSRISAALAEDFGCHPEAASDLIEVLGPIGRARHVLEHLEGWMQPSPRAIDAAMMGTAHAYIQSQPKGVVGNIVPWNFPFDLSIGPMIDMLAAGNRIIVKPSEHTPACAHLLREMMQAAFESSLVHVAVGGSELAPAFASLPWDHLLFTGSARVGRKVMQAAAQNLTPVTLELGGKCPAVLTPGAVTAANVESIIGTKTIKNGQMCISVDYCLVPRVDMETFIRLATDFMQRVAPAYSRSPDCTGIISQHHLERLSALLREAFEKGTRIVELEPHASIDPVTRRMPMSLVVNPAHGLRLMREEIFGPILPLLPYETLDEAIGCVNAGERPLGVYVFGDDPAQIDHVLDRVISGGAAVNACAVQGALPSLAFGGVGASGMGRHHGAEGFREFSNQRGVVVRGEGDHLDAFYAPYTKAAAMVAAALG